jgi:hypothetical protein
LAGAFAELAAFGGFEAAEGAAQERKGALEGVGRELGEPGIEGAPEAVVVEQDESAAVEEPFEPRGRVGGFAAGGEGVGESTEGGFVGFDSVVEETSGGGAGDETVETVEVGEALEGLMPGGGLVGVLEERHGLVHAAEACVHGLGGIVVERGAGPGQTDDDAGDHAVEDVSDPGSFDAADAAVAGDAGEGRDGVHELADGSSERGEILKAGDDSGDGVGKVGEEDIASEGSDGGEFGGAGGAVEGEAGGGVLDGVAPDGGFDDADGELGLPTKLPDLVEGTLAGVRFGAFAPGNFEEVEAMEEVASFEIAGLAEVEVEEAFEGLGF